MLYLAKLLWFLAIFVEWLADKILSFAGIIHNIRVNIIVGKRK